MHDLHVASDGHFLCVYPPLEVTPLLQVQTDCDTNTVGVSQPALPRVSLACDSAIRRTRFSLTGAPLDFLSWNFTGSASVSN